MRARARRAPPVGDRRAHGAGEVGEVEGLLEARVGNAREELARARGERAAGDEHERRGERRRDAPRGVVDVEAALREELRGRGE